MKKIIRKCRGCALLAVMSIFSLHIKAVFEGNTKPNDLPGIRTEVEVESLIGRNQDQKATGLAPGGNRTVENSLTGEAPIADSPFFILFLGGLACGSYILWEKRKLNKVD